MANEMLMKRTLLATSASIAALASVAGCGDHKVANPFASGVTGGKVVANVVICEPTPSTCGRYLVIDPSPGTAQAALIRSVEAVLQHKLGWHKSLDTPVPATQGVAFDGPTASQGAFVNTAGAEVRLDAGDLDTGASATSGRRVLTAMRTHPSAVVVRIVDAK